MSENPRTLWDNFKIQKIFVTEVLSEEKRENRA